MSLFSQEHSHKRSTCEELVDYKSLFYDGQKLEGSPALGAPVCGSSAISPLPVASDSVDSLLLNKMYICEHFAEAKEHKEELVADALFHEATAHCLGAEDSEASSTEVSPNEVFVYNIKYSATKAQLESVFSGCGAVASISLPFDKVSSRIKGYAFIAFERAKSVERAIEQMNGFNLNGRPLSVRRKTECKSPSPRSKTLGITKAATRSTFKFPGTDVSAVDATATLFVGNFPLHANRHQIGDLFSEASGAPLKAVRLVTTASGKSRGFGYVDFYSKKDAALALALNGHVVCGRVLRVNYAEGYKSDYKKKAVPKLEITPRLPAAGVLSTADIGPIHAPLFADASDCCRVPVHRPVVYFPLFQVPRGYALVPVTKVSLMQATRVGLLQPQQVTALLPF